MEIRGQIREEWDHTKAKTNYFHLCFLLLRHIDRRIEQILFIVYQRFPSKIAHFVLTRHLDGIQWTGLDAETAEDTAQNINIVLLRPLLDVRVRMLRRLDSDALGRTDSGTEMAGNTFFIVTGTVFYDLDNNGFDANEILPFAHIEFFNNDNSTFNTVIVTNEFGVFTGNITKGNSLF